MTLNDFLKFMQNEKRLTSEHRPLRLRLAFPNGMRDDILLPQRVTGVESICGGIEYRILALAVSADLPLKEFIALPAEIQFVTDRGGLRSVCGIVAAASAGNSDGGVASYELIVCDALALMRKRRNNRVFRCMNELAVIETIFFEWLQKNKVLVGSFELEIDSELRMRDFPVREMIRQHNESDAHFVCRLMKRRGISWFIRAGRSRTGPDTAISDRPTHTLVLFDHSRSLETNRAGTVRFHRDDSTEQRDTITAWSAARVLQPGRTTRYSWDYRKPRSSPFMTVGFTGDTDQGTTGNEYATSIEDYIAEAPHVGDDSQDHSSLGQLRMDRYDFEAKCYRGEGSVRDFCAGECFTLAGIPKLISTRTKSASL
jgi:type VI secretion system secreted protein VgrG